MIPHSFVSKKRINSISSNNSRLSSLLLYSSLKHNKKYMSVHGDSISDSIKSEIICDINGLVDISHLYIDDLNSNDKYIVEYMNTIIDKLNECDMKCADLVKNIDDMLYQMKIILSDTCSTDTFGSLREKDIFTRRNITKTILELSHMINIKQRELNMIMRIGQSYQNELNEMKKIDF
jgi:hypothetical protein